MKFPNIDIGHLDARNDQLLEKVFISPVKYNNIIQKKTCLVVGRRGTGKSAIVEQSMIDFSKMKDHIVLKIIDFDLLSIIDYSVHIKSERILGGDEKLLLKFYWLRFILIKIIEFLSHNGENILSQNTKKKIEKYNLIKDSMVKRIASIIQRIKVKIKDVEFSFEPEEKEEINSLYRTTEEIKELIQDDLRQKKIKLIVLIDELDKLEDKAKMYKHYIYSLLELSYNFDRNSFIHVILFIRQDIYTLLTGHVMAKVRGEAIDLDYAWTEETLKVMIKKRIEINRKTKFNEIFPEKDDFSVGYNQYSFDYVLQRTFYRPRDLMRITQILIDNMSSEFDTYKNVYEKSLDEYSEKTLSDITDEYRLNLTLEFKSQDFPDQLVYSLRGCKVKNDFAEIVQKLNKISEIQKGDIDVKDAIEKLYIMGVIGLDLGSGRSDKGFFYADTSQLKLVRSWNKKFIIHHGLRNALAIS